MQLILGPFSRNRGLFSTGFALFLIVLLTLLSQVGGVILWLAYGLGETLAARYRRSRSLVTVAAFVALYSVTSFLLLPALAPAFGRVALNCFADSRHPYAANSPLYCVLNRHYVTPGAKQVLEALSEAMARKHAGTVVSYLDGGFPLPLGIPLLPHLSHNDGRKLDLAFFYQDKTSGKADPKGGAWFLGYWAFAPAWETAKRRARIHSEMAPCAGAWTGCSGFSSTMNWTGPARRIWSGFSRKARRPLRSSGSFSNPISNPP